jgi:uncharacterized membrane protein
MIKHLLNNYPILVKLTIILLGVIFICGIGAVSPVAAQASKTNVCQGVDIAAGNNATGNGCSNNGESLNKVAEIVLDVISVFAGFIAVIMIIVGGLRYITSGGNDSAVAGAKNAILYAIVGLVIVILAQVIVHFVLGRSV